MAKRVKRKRARNAVTVKKRATRSPAGRKNAALGAGVRARIRMYRHGLGDCHIVRLPRKGDRDFVVMIDCGVVLGTEKASDKMSDVVRDIKKISGGIVDLLIVTHEHWDHLSGFIQAADEFSHGFQV